MGDITIDPDVFGEPAGDWDGWYRDPAVLVRTAQGEEAAAALHRAGARIRYLDMDGVVVTEEELVQGAETPSYVSPIYIWDVGLAMYADTAGDLSGPQGRAILAVLVDELEAAGVTAHLAPWPEQGTYTKLGQWAPPS